MIMAKINKTTTSMLVDSGAQSTVLGKKQFDNPVRGMALKQNSSQKKGICEFMGMGIYQLWVNLISFCSFVLSIFI